jgi:hypothetical protein
MMAMSVTMHPIWASGSVILAAGIAGTSLGGAIFSVIGATYAVLLAFMAAALVAPGLLMVGLSSPFYGAVTIAPDAYVGVREEMPVAH